MVRYGSAVLARAQAALSSATPPFTALPAAPGMARAHARAALAGWGPGEFADVTAVDDPMTPSGGAEFRFNV
jgi:hypothetical protein